ncbi:MAG: adenosylmethionine decarboxylase [Bdellovibrionales bacterium]|nr:adenosylmethionine decarboxylase [Bdellovibrionales bacterium]
MGFRESPHNQPMEFVHLLGLHTLVEYVGGNREVLARADALEPILLTAVEICGATYVDHRINQFSPYGASGVILIAESHMSFHSWPEHNYMALDLFTCSSTMDPTEAIDYIAEKIEAQTFHTRVLQRGY